ncbi:PREDICTED: uncharacterized protein LOC104806984 [Tarenaya hassleriana]|uniref:uncharacterized protein LOC104806984 n=1 Tax=Tarenaya hassleriana TaxID=28532 RepID=UPI00053CA4AE|nr:PREDICTED: uncharacterized protein LOC104806984 [Tarenaya hassleriana]
MTLLAPALPLPLPSLDFKAKAFASVPWSPFHGRVSTCARFERLPCSSMGGSPRKYVELIGISETVQEDVLKSLRDFPWRKAETLLMQRLMSLGRTLLKWSFVAWFVISSVSDVLTSIAISQELMVPLGLLIGCLVCELLKETASVMLPDSEEKGLYFQFFGISCFFVIIKFVSAIFGSRTRMFLLHFGNGGVLQLLWLFSGMLWRRSSCTTEQNRSPEDASE